MMQESTLLKPMRADSLLRPQHRPAAAAELRAPEAAASARGCGSPLMRPAAFAPWPVHREPETSAFSSDLLEDLSWLEDDALLDETEDGSPEAGDEDAVPTALMATPVSVPLTQEIATSDKPRRAPWICAGSLLALVALGWALWRMGLV